MGSICTALNQRSACTFLSHTATRPHVVQSGAGKNTVFGLSLNLYWHLQQIARAARFACSVGNAHRSWSFPHHISVNLALGLVHTNTISNVTWVTQNCMTMEITLFSLVPVHINAVQTNYGKGSSATLVRFQHNSGPIEYANCIQVALNNRTESRIKIWLQQCEPNLRPGSH